MPARRTLQSIQEIEQGIIDILQKQEELDLIYQQLIQSRNILLANMTLVLVVDNKEIKSEPMIQTVFMAISGEI